MKFEELIEKYRLPIGGILVLAIICGSAVLIWRENYQKPSIDDRIKNNELRIKQLEEDSAKKQDTSNNITDQTSNTQTEVQGQVAGASSNSTTQPASPAGGSSSSSAAKPVSGTVNLNTASLSELDSLTGIGPVYAQRIIDYRNEKGGFKSIDEVKNVKGIGEKTFEKFKGNIGI